MATGYSLAGLIANLYNMIYPIGICIDFKNNTNPNDAFPGTTWVQVTDGRAYRASPNAALVGTFVGSDSVTLTVNNLAQHFHAMPHQHAISHDHGRTVTDQQGLHSHYYRGNTDTTGGHTHTMAGKVTGNGDGLSSGFQGVLNYVQTSFEGMHTHVFEGYTNETGAHAHNVVVPPFQGWSGDTNTPNTANAGSATPVTVTNASRYYARWERTA